MWSRLPSKVARQNGKSIAIVRSRGRYRLSKKVRIHYHRNNRPASFLATVLPQLFNNTNSQALCRTVAASTLTSGRTLLRSLDKRSRVPLGTTKMEQTRNEEVARRRDILKVKVVLPPSGHQSTFPCDHGDRCCRGSQWTGQPRPRAFLN